MAQQAGAATGTAAGEVSAARAHVRRTFIFVLQIGILVCAIYTPLNLLRGDSIDAAINAFVLVCLALALRHIRAGGDIARPIEVLAAIACASIAVQGWRQGGLYGPTLWWLIVVPVLMISCGRDRSALAWTVVICAIVGLVMGTTPVTRSGEAVVAMLPATVGPVFVATVMVSLFVCLIIFHVLVERARRRALAELERTTRDLRETADALAARNQELTAARDLAMEESRIKTRLVANISHELRTPLNAVIGSIELLTATASDERRHDYVATLKRSSRHLAAIIDDILDFSRLDAGRVDIERAPFDPLTVVEDVVGLFRADARERGLLLRARIAADVPACVLGDARRVQQILANLLGNALKFTAAGAIDVALEQVGAEGDSARLCFSVRDEGVGIPPDRLETIFRPFERGDADGERAPIAGTGLGLAIARELAELMDGRIVVESNPGEGSRFALELPLRAVAASTRVDTPADLPAGACVIEPDAVQRAALETQLARLGVACLASAASANDAIRAALAAGAGESANGPALLVAADSVATTPREAAGCIVVTLPTTAPLPAPSALPPAAQLLELPCTRQRLHASLAGAPAALADTSPVPTRRERILLVEDNETNQKLAVAMLEELGYLAATASDGIEALDAARADAFDVILMDCRMPRMDGLAATRAIRTLEAEQGRAPARIVELTGDANEHDRARCLAAGMDDFINKPSVFEDLEAALAAR
ncbi:MAG: ATP-binding protein [Gammaproteobacteria bacterium]